MTYSLDTTSNADDQEREDGQAVAGPSNWWRRLRGHRQLQQQMGDSALNDREALEGMEEQSDGGEKSHLVWTRRNPSPPRAIGKRQATSSIAPPNTVTSSSSSYSPASLFVPPTSTSSSFSISTFTPSGGLSSSQTTGSALTNTISSLSSLSTSSSISSQVSQSVSPTASQTSFSSLYSTARRPNSPAPAASPTFVAGKTFNLTLGGTRDDEAVYAVQVELGHGDTNAVQNYRLGAGQEEISGDMRRESRKRQVAETGPGFQSLKLQVDLGSSDMWVAVTNCSTSDCTSAPTKFDNSQSISSGVRSNMTYHSGSVSGEIMWEEMQIDKFSISYQAYIAGDRVLNENLGGGNFSGVLGMALPANSIISNQIPGTTSSNPDGATFLDNLFGSGAAAPSQRIFSLALERREDVRTTSILTIGSTYDRYCPSPCSPSYISIIANPNLGVTGYLYWRIPLMGIQATTWDDSQRGTGPTVKNVTLGGSTVVTSRSQPLAVMDSGGVAILVGHKPYADAIYSAYGITASPDGYYRMPCKTQLSFSFNFGGKWYPAHPLDMSWPDPTDPSQTTCIGAIQYTTIPNDAGDFIFGSSFLKNVYSIFSYPDQTKTTGTWQPGVGLISLTNASVASQDFYAVRTLRQSLAQVSSQGPFIGGSNSPSSPSSTPSSGSGGTVVNTTAIVAGSVVGFFVLAAVAFSAWFFFLKRKYGNNGYPLGSRRAGSGRDTPNSEPTTTSTRRTKKHLEAHRQKSMIEGYSDYEGDSWTEIGDSSMRLGYLPGVREEGDDEMRGKRVGSVGSGSMINSDGVWGSAAGLNEKAGEDGDGYNEKIRHSPDSLRAALPILPSSPHARARSASRSRLSETHVPDSIHSYPPNPTSPISPGFTTPLMPYAQPLAEPSPKSAGPPRRRDANRTGSGSMSMSGPFPTTMGRQRPGDMADSPMYEIRSADYFEVGEIARGRRGSMGLGLDGASEARNGNGSGSRER